MNTSTSMHGQAYAVRMQKTRAGLKIREIYYPGNLEEAKQALIRMILNVHRLDMNETIIKSIEASDTHSVFEIQAQRFQLKVYMEKQKE